MSSHRDKGVAGTPERDRPTGGAAPPSDTSSADTSRGKTTEARPSAATRADRTGNMLPGRARRSLGIERLLVRLVATSGIVAIGVALGAILVSSGVQGWITGLVVALVSVVLAAMLWSSRQL